MTRHLEPTIIWTEDSIEERREHETQAAADVATGFLCWIAIICLAWGLFSWR